MNTVVLLSVKRAKKVHVLLYSPRPHISRRPRPSMPLLLADVPLEKLTSSWPILPCPISPLAAVPFTLSRQFLPPLSPELYALKIARVRPFCRTAHTAPRRNNSIHTRARSATTAGLQAWAVDRAWPRAHCNAVNTDKWIALHRQRTPSSFSELITTQLKIPHGVTAISLTQRTNLRRTLFSVRPRADSVSPYCSRSF